MNRNVKPGQSGELPVPRASGDEPSADWWEDMIVDCSPRERG